MYQYISNEDGINVVDIIKRTSDGATIPFDPANTDYQEYLQFLADGGVPEPADTPEVTE